MNDLAHPMASRELADPSANDPFAAYGDAASTQIFVGDLLKCSKGDYYAGQEERPIPLGTRVIANMHELMVGWVKWEDNKPSEQMMGRLIEGHRPAPRKELGDLDKEEWETDNFW